MENGSRRSHSMKRTDTEEDGEVSFPILSCCYLSSRLSDFRGWDIIFWAPTPHPLDLKVVQIYWGLHEVVFIDHLKWICLNTFLFTYFKSKITHSISRNQTLIKFEIIKQMDLSKLSSQAKRRKRLQIGKYIIAYVL